MKLITRGVVFVTAVITAFFVYSWFIPVPVKHSSENAVGFYRFAIVEWGYSNGYGKLVIYDKLGGFSDYISYLMGQKLDILPNVKERTSHHYTCYFPSIENGHMITEFKNCITSVSGNLEFNPLYMDDVDFDHDDLACIYGDFPESSPVFYLHRSGKLHEVVWYDNGCDYFQDGLARGVAEGKQVYINPSLEVVLNPSFTHLFPFENQRAIVCNGQLQMSDYGPVQGGKCGLIDTTGTLILEPVYEINDPTLRINIENGIRTLLNED